MELMELNESLINPRVHFLSGKGGVGKSVLSQVLAEYFAISGFKTLHVSLSEEESALGMQIANMDKVKDNLWSISIYPDQALFEYLTLKIHNEKILKHLLSKNLFKSLCSAMPGLADLTRLGKIWYHADINAFKSERPIFDKIVVDFPSSGFVRRFLSVAKIAAEAVRFGPLAKEASHMYEYFKNPAHARLHLVTLPEDLSVSESYELYKEMLASEDISLGFLLINKVFNHTFDETGEMPPTIASMVSFFKARAKAQSQELLRIKTLGLNMPQIMIEEQMGACDTSLILLQIAASINLEPIK